MPPLPMQSLIKQYSEFISFPIKLWSASSVPVQVGAGRGAGWVGAWVHAGAMRVGTHIRYSCNHPSPSPPSHVAHMPRLPKP